MNFLASTWFVVPVFAICVFALSYTWWPKIAVYVRDRTTRQREEVFTLLDLMAAEYDREKLTRGMYALAFGLGGLSFLALWPNFLLGAVVGSVVGILGFSIPPRLVRQQYDARCNKVVEQMVDGITILANGMSAGLSVQQAMQRVTENMPNPIAKEFSLVLQQLSLSSGLDVALAFFGNRIPRPDVQMFVSSISILSETGGNMIETMQTISQTIRERQKLEKKIEAMTANGIFQGIVITLIPFALLIMMALAQPEMMKPMFTTPVGILLLIIMLGFQIAGAISIRKIVKIEV